MKEAIIIDFNGFMTDVTLVADDATGVFPFYRTQEPLAQEDIGQQLNTEMLGYVVAIPVPQGLFKPRFDIESWNEYIQLQPLELDKDGKSPTEMPEHFSYSPRQQETFWIEGLMPEEIVAGQNPYNHFNIEQKVDVLTAKLPKMKEPLVYLSRLWKK
ncbi:hypothetical protein [Paenibacillus ehimensis]|uniref:Uncharacterized protein n=1 Tax=Paenibacillus ehimensis TaxID=79264 RepID=A0ABT8VCI1_9BACL|nr:hypothetical protein [Paenibacillus ehimensis]MDO3678695.1 hypothetical protein [Paenibacillus ehimensis]